MLPILYAVLMAIIPGYAIIRDGWAERSVALILPVGGIPTSLAAAPLPATFRPIGNRTVAVAFSALVLPLAFALSSRRFWRLWVAAMRRVAIPGHPMPPTSRATAIVYANAMTSWRWPMLFLIGRATYRHRRRLTGITSPS